MTDENETDKDFTIKSLKLLVEFWRSQAERESENCAELRKLLADVLLRRGF